MTNELRERMTEFGKWLLVKKGISYITIHGYQGSASRLIRAIKQCWKLVYTAFCEISDAHFYWRRGINSLGGYRFLLG